MRKPNNTISLSLKEANQIGDLLEDAYQLAGAADKPKLKDLNKFRKAADSLWKIIEAK